MERNELVIVIVLVLISLALGIGVYSVFFHPLTAEVRVRFKGGQKRAVHWLKTHARRIVLVLVIAAVGIALLSLGARYGGSIVRGVGALLSGWKSAAEVKREPQRPAELDSTSVESMTPEFMPAETEAPESTAPEESAPGVTPPEASALEQPALQPTPPASEQPEPQ